MKKGILLGVWMVIWLSACQKQNDPAPGERPDERLNKILTDYKTQLVSAPHGWKATLLPDGGGGYSFLLRFGENDRVTMTADINPATAAEAFESTYRLKAVQRPSLLFDTYSYLHILSDPDASKSGGDWGQGRYSDFEFFFDSATSDQITLTGHLKGSKLILERATQQEAQSYIQQITANARVFENINTFTTYFKRLAFGANTVDVNADTNRRTITFSYFEGDVLRTFSTSFRYTQTGIVLIQPFVVAGAAVTELSNIQYAPAGRRLNLTVNNQAATIQEAAAPIRIDQEATRRFFETANDDYYASETGFTVNGVIDAFQVRTIPNYYFLIFWPKFGTSNGRAYDLLGTVFFNRAENRPELGYGPVATSRLTTDGRVIYTALGTIGEIPTAYAPIINAMNQAWTEARGFYVIPTGDDSYDLVSANGARTWINLF
jgi:hypothetical protein